MCGVSSSGRDRVRRPGSAGGRHTAGRGGGARTRERDEVQPGFGAGTATSGSDRRRGHQHPDQSFGGPLGFRVRPRHSDRRRGGQRGARTIYRWALAAIRRRGPLPHGRKQHRVNSRGCTGSRALQHPGPSSRIQGTRDTRCCLATKSNSAQHVSTRSTIACSFGGRCRERCS